MKDLANISTDELIYELIKRHGQVAAPIKTDRYVPHQESILPIGDDNTASLILSDDDMAALEARLKVIS